ncbi:unnamed protein product [Lota lota]
MDKESNHQLLRRLRPQLIEILSADPDFVLQYAFSDFLVTDNGYKSVSPLTISTEKVTTLLDHIYDRGPQASLGLLKLLKSDRFQENFPRLSILVNQDVDLNLSTEEASKRTTEAEQSRSTKQPGMSGSKLVTQKQMMTVAGAMSRNWKEVGIQGLEISSEKLDEIEADNRGQKMRAFHMLNFWRSRENTNATAAKLYSLLRNEEFALDPEKLQSLQEGS